MLVRDGIDHRLSVRPGQAEPPEVRLPTYLPNAHDGARIAILSRLSANRRFAFGARAGSGGLAGLRLDLRQRVVVKALVSRHARGRTGRSALARHVAYLGREGTGPKGPRGAFFNGELDELDAAALTADWAADRHHFRLIISPEHGERIADLPRYVREVMGKVADDLQEPQMQWLAICHFDTDQPHAHVLVRGRRVDGRDLIMPRAYISHGVRSRAQEAAQALLGDLTRSEAEARVWRETQANCFTQLDRRLLQAAGPDRLAPDGVGRSDAWSALSRGRLRYLERVGLAQRVGGAYRLSPSLEEDLRRAQLRMDVVRTLNQRRLEGARDVRLQLDAVVRGKVVQAGFHDELGAAGFVVVRDRDGVEHYAPLRAGAGLPRAGAQVTLEPLSGGRATIRQAQLDQSL